jgi:drug/metabolite transporter (DMT)-like permease
MKVALNFVAPATFVFHRSLISSVALFPIVFLLRKRIPKDTNTLVKLLFLSFLFILQVTATTVGLVGESSGMGSILTSIQPLFVYCLAVKFLQEKTTILRSFGILLGFAGIVLILLGRIVSIAFGSSLILVSGAFFWAGSTVYYKKNLGLLDAFIVVYFQLAASLFPFAMFSALNNTLFVPLEATYLLVISYSAIGSMATGTLIWLFLLKREKATVLSGSSFAVPLVAIFLGWLFLEEDIAIHSVVGAAMVLGGVCLVNLHRE